MRPGLVVKAENTWRPSEEANLVPEDDPLLLSIDKLIRLSRLKEIEFIMSHDRAERLRGIRAALRRLQPGQYLLGTGPSTVGIIPLDNRDVVLGRPPTLLEAPCEDKPDHWAIDTLYFVPREVSRAHAKLIADPTDSGLHHRLIDLNSTCGTFLNQTKLQTGGPGAPLRHGDVISLGPSQTSTYVYYHVPATHADEQHPATSAAQPERPHTISSTFMDSAD